jgi:heme/copper-type cytochrome/quinol oxidase subunit 2
MVVGIIIAAGIAVGAAVGLYQMGEGVKKRQEEVGKATAKSINWIAITVAACIVMGLLVFFMTRSRASAKLGQGIAIQGGGVPVAGGGAK